MEFEFTTANRIIFGPGTARQTGKLARKLGRNALVVTGKASDRNRFLFQDLTSHNIEFTMLPIPEEPTVAMISSGVDKARKVGCDLVIAIGGGSAIDSGKAIAALLTNHGRLTDYLEVVGRGKSIREEPAPSIALPTTAGTGAEVTCNSVLLSEEPRVKVSMRSPLMLPRIVIVDPELTYSMPPDVTASTGLDAFTQLLEAFVSIGANPMTDAVCREGMKRAAAALERVYIDGSDKAARYDMCLASFFGGLALSNAKLGAVHGIAGTFGGMFPSPHGAVCGRLLPAVMEVNIASLKRHMPGSESLSRYHEIGQMVASDGLASAEDGVAWVEKLCERLKMPPLGIYGVSENDFADIIRQSQKASSMKGNPLRLKNEELHGILQKVL